MERIRVEDGLQGGKDSQLCKEAKSSRENGVFNYAKQQNGFLSTNFCLVFLWRCCQYPTVLLRLIPAPLLFLLLISRTS